MKKKQIFFITVLILAIGVFFFFRTKNRRCIKFHDILLGARWEEKPGFHTFENYAVKDESDVIIEVIFSQSENKTVEAVKEIKDSRKTEVRPLETIINELIEKYDKYDIYENPVFPKETEVPYLHDLISNKIYYWHKGKYSIFFSYFDFPGLTNREGELTRSPYKKAQ